MSFIQRELGRVTTELQTGKLAADERGQLYAIQQALSWALEPKTFKSPYDLIVRASGTPRGSEDYPEENDHSAFSSTHDGRESRLSPKPTFPAR